MAHILIIDDSPTDVRVFTTLLEKNGHRVSSAASAEEGIAAAKRERAKSRRSGDGSHRACPLTAVEQFLDRPLN